MNGVGVVGLAPLTSLSLKAHPFLLAVEKNTDNKGRALKSWAGWAALLLPSGVVHHEEVYPVLHEDPLAIENGGSLWGREHLPICFQ